MRRRSCEGRPPDAATARPPFVRPLSSATRTSDSAYWNGSPHAPTPMSSQQCSRSVRMRLDTHQTAGW